jgi:hypothetical protein
MDQTKVEGVIRRLAKTDLLDLAERAIDDGEQTHAGNRDAIRAFVIEANDIKGLKAVQELLKGVDSWDASLKEFENAAKTIARKAAAALQGPEDAGRDGPHREEDSGDAKGGKGRSTGGKGVADKRPESRRDKTAPSRRPAIYPSRGQSGQGNT